MRGAACRWHAFGADRSEAKTESPPRYVFKIAVTLIKGSRGFFIWFSVQFSGNSLVTAQEIRTVRALFTCFNCSS